MVVGSVGQSALPRLALYFSHGRTREFRALALRLLLIGAALGVCGVLAALAFGRQIVTLIYGSEYAQNSQLFLWLMVAAAAGYMASFGGCCLTAARYFQVQLPLFSSVTAVTLALCYVMVKADGAIGAAKALAIAGFFQLIATFAILWYLESRRAPNAS